MNVLHLMSRHPKFNDNMVQFYKKQFQNYKHEICIIRGDEFICSDVTEESQLVISYAPTKDFESRKNLVHKMENYDVIVCHSMVIDPKLMVHILLKHRELLKKIVWIEYGHDLYHRYSMTPKAQLQKVINYLFVKSIKASVMIFPPDEKVFRARYGKKPISFCAPYTSGERNPLLDISYHKISMAEKIKQCQPIIIQVGHSSSRHVRHIEILNRLSKFKDENIIIRLPMSYGPEDYARTVIDHASSIFGKKLDVVTDFVPLEEYYASLADVDIAIWETSRQIALGNINPLIYMNKKIYLSTDSIMFGYFRDNGVEIGDANDINKCSFTEFIQDVSDDNGLQHRDKMFNVQESVKSWEKIYTWLENH